MRERGRRRGGRGERPRRAGGGHGAERPPANLGARLALGPAEPRLAPTKGMHVILPDRRLPAALLLLHPRDGRVFFVIPWLGKTLVGTTDTNTVESPDALTVQPDEIDYLMEAWRHYFPNAGDVPVLGAFAGLRPLIRAKPGEPSARSREFRVFTSPSGLVSVAGGKYTTFRAMAEQITDVLAPRIGKRTRCRTRRLALASAPPQPWPAFRQESLALLTRRFGLSESVALRLIQRYGAARHATRAREDSQDDPEAGGRSGRAGHGAADVRGRFGLP